MQAAKAGTRLCGCRGSYEFGLLADAVPKSHVLAQLMAVLPGIRPLSNKSRTLKLIGNLIQFVRLIYQK